MNQYKAVLLGANGVGKTCIYSIGCRIPYRNNFIRAPLPLFIRVNFQGKQIDFYDTAGQEEFDSLSKSYARDANVIFFVTSCSKDYEKDDDRLLKYLTDVKDLGPQLLDNVIFFINKKDILEKETGLTEDERAKQFLDKVNAFQPGLANMDKDTGNVVFSQAWNPKENEELNVYESLNILSYLERGYQRMEYIPDPEDLDQRKKKKCCT